MKDIKLYASLTKECTVTKELLASSVGSGIVNVYATPMMIALMENTAATLLSQFLDEGETSVGVSIQASHDAATPEGMKVWATAEIIDVDRKKVTFHIEAKDEKDRISEATHARFIVNKEKFEAKAQQKKES